MTDYKDVLGALNRLKLKAKTPEEREDIEKLERTILSHSKTGHQSTIALEQDIERAQNRRKQTSEELQPYFAVVDIDYFKKINDALGYDEGDKTIKEVLSVVDETIEDNLRFYDIPDPLERDSSVYHEHGEEFPVFLFARNNQEARNIFERVRMAVKGICKENLDYIVQEIGFDITVSISYTRWNFENETHKQAKKRRDRYKSMAKYAGRDCTMGDGHKIEVSDEELDRFEKQETEKRYEK